MNKSDVHFSSGYSIETEVEFFFNILLMWIMWKILWLW